MDSLVVTALAHRALGKKLKTCFIDTGIIPRHETALSIDTIGSACPEKAARNDGRRKSLSPAF